MIFALFTWFCGWVQADTSVSSAEKWTGRFNISGFSFIGSVPGAVTFGPEDQFNIALFRPSGLPIMSATFLNDQVCFLFDMDGVQYQGTPSEFTALSNGALSTENIALLFAPDVNTTPNGWDWLSTPRYPVRRLTVETKDALFLRARYGHWSKNNPRPKRVSVYLEPNMWKLRAQFKRVEPVSWSATCDVTEDIQVQSLDAMLQSIPKR